MTLRLPLKVVMTIPPNRHVSLRPSLVAPELAEIAALLADPDCRLLTLQWPGRNRQDPSGASGRR